MEPKDAQLRNKQRERNQRGNDFQEEIRRSWRHIPATWRIRIPDGGGGSRPGDELVLTQEFNVLAELKRTKSRRFSLSFLRQPQIRGLVDFDQVIPRNLGLVYVSFHDPGKGLDECYAIRLLTALRYMQKKQREYITLEELAEGKVPAVRLPRLDTAEPTYDLRGLLECYKSL